MVQQHLSYKEMTDFGCFYTPQKFVDKLINMIKTNVHDYKEYTYLDSSCGYGSFLKSLYPLKTIGCDIDKQAIEKAKLIYSNSEYYTLNALHNFTRDSILISKNEKLIIIGNPPYNDTTSKVKNEIKMYPFTQNQVQFTVNNFNYFLRILWCARKNDTKTTTDVR